MTVGPCKISISHMLFQYSVFVMSCFLICMVDILHLEVKSACSLYYSRCFMVFVADSNLKIRGDTNSQHGAESIQAIPFLHSLSCHSAIIRTENPKAIEKGWAHPALRGIDSTAILCHEFPTKQRGLAIFRGCPTLLFYHQLSLVSNMSSYSQAFKQQVAVAKRKNQKQKVNSGELR